MTINPYRTNAGPKPDLRGWSNAGQEAAWSSLYFSVLTFGLGSLAAIHSRINPTRISESTPELCSPALPTLVSPGLWGFASMAVLLGTCVALLLWKRALAEDRLRNDPRESASAEWRRVLLPLYGANFALFLTNLLYFVERTTRVG